MKTDNELIAEFMEGVYNQDEDYPEKWIFKTQPNKFHRSDAKHLTVGLLYDTSWDWLMPFLVKLDEVLEDYYEKYRVIPVFEDDPFDIHINEIPITTSITTVYENAVVLLKWYNVKVAQLNP